MTIPHKYSILLIGGSAGSMPVLVELLSRLSSRPITAPMETNDIIHYLRNISTANKS